MKNISTYIISLSSELERRASISQQLNYRHIDFQIIDAVNAKELEQNGSYQTYLTRYNHVKEQYKKLRQLSSGEVACALSHHSIYQKVIDDTDKYALILEDDAKLIRDLTPLLQPENLDKIYQQSEFDVLILGYVKTLEKQLPFYYRRIPIKFKANLILENNQKIQFGTPWEQYGCGTVAYVITRKGAEKLLSATKDPIVSADNWLFFEKNAQLNILHSRPAFVLEDLDRFLSSIRVEKKDFLKWSWHSILIRSIKGWWKYFLMNVIGIK